MVKKTLKEVSQIYLDHGFQLLSEDYINNHSKMPCLCLKHKEIGVQMISLHNFDSILFSCPECLKEHNYRKNTRHRHTEEDIKNTCEQFNLIYAGYYYKKVKSGTVLIVRFICPKHTSEGIQEAKYSNLIKSKFGCRFCAGIKISMEDVLNIKTGNPYIIPLQIKYDPRVKINKILCKCQKCGRQFLVSFDHYKEGKGCPHCNMSHGEVAIEKLLTQYDIPFIKQYSFSDCVYQDKLKFDFWIPSYNTCIEFQGKQHYLPVKFWSDNYNIADAEYNLSIIQKRDEIKRQYCDQNNINLIEIPYWDINHIDQYLKTFILETTVTTAGS